MNAQPTPGTPSEVDVWSLDGLTFTYRGPISSGLPLGAYLAIRPGDGDERLGQLLAHHLVEHPGGRHVEGEGRFVDGVPGAPFDGGDVRLAPEGLVRAMTGRMRAPMEIGRLRGRDDIPSIVAAKGFNRHTFLCGQSGSGKTYALGVLLERLILHTRLPLLVLDPNGDHVHLGRTRSEIDDATARAYADAAGDVQVLRATPAAGEHPLTIRFGELGVEGPEALLGMDAIRDRDEYNALVQLIARASELGLRSVQEALDAMVAAQDPVLDGIHRRAENLGIDQMSVWASTDDRTLAQRWDEDRPRALIADTSGFEGRRERVSVAVAVLQQLWARRAERRPLLLVVDEAHDVCPADAADPLQRLAVELFTRIAGEGRKYGIHLLLASQRPDKLPDNVLSQCDNLLLMRVNSVGERRALADRFGFAPPGLVELAGTFGLGETLVAGTMVPSPTLTRIGLRLTPEGGADVATDWAG